MKNKHPASFKDDLKINDLSRFGAFVFRTKVFFTKMAAIESGIVPASPVTSVEPVGCVLNCYRDLKQDVTVISPFRDFHGQNSTIIEGKWILFFNENPFLY